MRKQGIVFLVLSETSGLLIFSVTILYALVAFIALMTVNSFSSLARCQEASRLCSLNMARSGGGQSLKCQGPVQRITRNVRQSQHSAVTKCQNNEMENCFTFLYIVGFIIPFAVMFRYQTFIGRTGVQQLPIQDLGPSLFVKTLCLIKSSTKTRYI